VDAAELGRLNMAGMHDGGILSGILSGWRAGEQDRRERDEFAERQEMRAAQQRNEDVRGELARMNLNGAKMSQRIQEANSALGRGLLMSERSGDWGAFTDAFNQTVGRDMGFDLVEMKADRDGKLRASTNFGKTLEFDSPAHLRESLAYFAAPSTYIDGMMSAQRQRASRPARLQQAEEIFSRLQPVAGESEDDRWLRAFEIARQGAGRPAAQQQEGRTPRAVKQPARGGGPLSRVVSGQDWAREQPDAGPRSPAAPLVPANAGAPAHVPMPAARPAASSLFGDSVIEPSGYGAPGAPRGAVPARGRIVRTGRLPDGRRMGELEDGSIVEL
jgi:hypothetical protein